jgi:hypothetical protein
VAERTIVVDHKTISYEGLFSAKELYRIVDKWFFDKGYDKSEKKNFEHVYPAGKQMELELWPWRKFTDYARVIMKVHFLMTNVKEVEIEKDGLKTKVNQGKVILTINAYIETDYEQKWEYKPMFVFIRTMFDKFVYSVHTGRYDQFAIDEVNHLVSLVKGYLNINRL